MQSGQRLVVHFLLGRHVRDGVGVAVADVVADQGVDHVDGEIRVLRVSDACGITMDFNSK